MFFIRSSVDGHLVCFYILAGVNNAAIKNIGMHGSFQISVYVPFRYIPRSRVAPFSSLTDTLSEGELEAPSSVLASIYQGIKLAGQTGDS